MIPSQSIVDTRAAQQRTGASDLAAALALALAGPESSYRADARGDYMLGGQIVPAGTPGAIPTSFGYTQLHTDAGGDGGGLGNGYSVEQLLDPVTNFSIAMTEIQRRLDAGADAYGALAPWSTRDQAMGLLPEAAAALGGNIPRGIAAEGGSLAAFAALAIAAIVLLNL